MGKPAARIGDTTVHGGAITVGCPTVLIGGMPAARLGDMHVCPMVTPAPAPIPHVGGPISLGSTGVFIGGMPAARMGDMCVCAGPPDTIAMGCTTVLIGEMGSGSSSGGGASSPGGASSAKASAATAVAGTLSPITKREHWIKVQFVDKAGLPLGGYPYSFTNTEGKEQHSTLGLDGSVVLDGIKAGQCKAVLFGIRKAEWSKTSAQVGEKVKLTAQVDGYGNGTKAAFEIYRRDIKGPDALVSTVEVEVKSGKMEAEWEYVLPQEEPENEKETPLLPGYSLPDYYFLAIIGKSKARSNILSYKSYIEINLVDANGKSIPNEKYVIHFSSGETREGALDGNGHAKVENVPPVRHTVSFPNYSEIKRIK